MLALFYQMKLKKHKNETDTIDYFEKLKQVETKTDRKIDVNISCRVCLQNASNSVFKQNNSEEIVEIMELFNVFIKEEDEYPKLLCHVCLKFINSLILFKKTALESNKILRQPVKEESFPLIESDNPDYSDDNTYEVKESDKWNNDEGNIDQKNKEKVKYNAKVTCHICNKVINRSYYKEHLTMHDPDHKKYVCDVCGKSFRLRCAYHNHSLRHRTDFPYKCQFCPYKGRYAELLKNHMRTHTGDYRYMCTECPAQFLFKSNLNSHMLKHKEPLYKCDSCKRAFHTKLMLQRHFEADHLGIKNHVCNMCGKAFGYRNAMMKHQRHVHKRAKLLFGRMPAYLQAEIGNKHKDNI